MLLAEQASWVQRMQKALVQMNIQLTEVLTDVMGITGQAIIRDIVAGERDPQVLAASPQRRVKASADGHAPALTGNWREEHLFVLHAGAGNVRRPRAAAGRVRCQDRGAARASWAAPESTLGKAPKRAGSKSSPAFDVRQALANWAGVDLTRINGLGGHLGDEDAVGDRTGLEPLRQRQALLFLARPVPWHQDQRRQGPVGGTKRSANRVRQALKMAAMSLSRSDSALGAFYRRLCSRMDKPRANTAVAHKLARMVYFMLTRGEDYVDQGQQHYEEHGDVPIAVERGVDDGSSVVMLRGLEFGRLASARRASSMQPRAASCRGARAACGSGPWHR